MQSSVRRPEITLCSFRQLSRFKCKYISNTIFTVDDKFKNDCRPMYIPVLFLNRTKYRRWSFRLAKQPNSWTKYKQSTSILDSPVGSEFTYSVSVNTPWYTTLHNLSDIFADHSHKVLCIELRGADASVRVRQIKVFGTVSGNYLAHGRQYSYSTVQHRQCESETLKVFRSITFQVRKIY